MELNERVDIRSGYFCVLEVEQKLEAAEGGEGQKGGDQRSSRVKRILRPQTAVLLPQAREMASHQRADATHCAFQAGGLGLQRSPEVPGEWANRSRRAIGNRQQRTAKQPGPATLQQQHLTAYSRTREKSTEGVCRCPPLATPPQTSSRRQHPLTTQQCGHWVRTAEQNASRRMP
ncbi:hypothetical protein NM208_g14179 [Fusarium decemcellulare]|uniref:Uncharacterized protein n=1 Tax=Fusarium decemcellulare TaxID=57161 RepID=A0ACC1RGY6_9HYPO|nr:hypothetical protein NM208_g14179 [Fusarium decemcellulare]